MENMDKGLTGPKWVLINCLKIPQLPQNLSAQIVCPSPKVWGFDEKRLHWVSVVGACIIHENFCPILTSSQVPLLIGKDGFQSRHPLSAIQFNGTTVDVESRKNNYKPYKTLDLRTEKTRLKSRSVPQAAQWFTNLTNFDNLIV